MTDLWSSAYHAYLGFVWFKLKNILDPRVLSSGVSPNKQKITKVDRVGSLPFSSNILERHSLLFYPALARRNSPEVATPFFGSFELDFYLPSCRFFF